MAEKINYELDTLILKQKKLLVLDIQTGFFFRMKKKPVISNTDNFFCFNSNVSNLNNNDLIIYKIKKQVERTVLFVNEFSYYNIVQIVSSFIKVLQTHRRPLTAACN